MVALFLGNEYQLSWAAPEQNPYMQTVPPRPTATSWPTPTPSSSGSIPTRQSAPDAETGDNDNDDDEEGVLLPTRAAGADTSPDDVEVIEPADDDGNTPAKAPQPNNAAQGQNKAPGPASGQGNTGSQVPITPQQADLSLISQLDNPIPKLGEIITVTTIISNSGPSRVTNVMVRDALPPGMRLSSVLASRGSYDANTGVWIISTIGRSNQVTMTIAMRVMETDPITITAEVIAADQFDPDSTPDNTLATEDDQASVTITPLAEPALAAQNRSDLVDLETTPPQAQETLALSNEAGWLYWLYALIVGTVLVFVGVQLVHRS
jgi:uncharacterized repeat protein (TIGR01451 family)